MLLSSPVHNIMDQPVCLLCFCEISGLGHAAAMQLQCYSKLGSMLGWVGEKQSKQQLCLKGACGKTSARKMSHQLH